MAGVQVLREFQRRRANDGARFRQWQVDTRCPFTTMSAYEGPAVSSPAGMAAIIASITFSVACVEYQTE